MVTDAAETVAAELAFAPEAPMPAAGADFGAYRLLSILGRGGFGVVWEAEHRRTGRRVALKVVTDSKPRALKRSRDSRAKASWRRR
jgi:eukaryotic-like serine/threonine-protein kinase